MVEEFWDATTLARCRPQAGGDAVTTFLEELRVFLGASGRIWAARSGSEALRQFLLDAVPTKNRGVLLCSFNCRLVADAVLRAGSRVQTFDLADVTGRIDWEQLANRLDSHLAGIIVPHLFGVPSDFRPLLAAAERSGVLIIEDCAHTLGGKIGLRAAGTLGDAAIFSFNFDKPISLGGGGALLVNNPELWSKIRLREAGLTVEREERELSFFLEYLKQRREGGSSRATLAAAVMRTLRGIASRATSGRAWSPSLRPFPVSGIGPLRAALGRWQLRRYPEIVRRRNANAAYFASAAQQTWYTGPDVSPAWLKQKVIPPHLDASPRIAQALCRRGMPIGRFNWSETIDEYLGTARQPMAAHVARNSLDVPIHQNVERVELDMICKAFWGGNDTDGLRGAD